MRDERGLKNAKVASVLYETILTHSSTKRKCILQRVVVRLRRASAKTAESSQISRDSFASAICALYNCELGRALGKRSQPSQQQEVCVPYPM